MKTIRTVAALITVVLLLGSSASADTTEESKSLDKCQKTAAKEAGKYMAQRVKNIAGCLQKVSGEVVKTEGADPASDAAKGCIAKFRKIENSEKPDKTLAAKAAAKIAKACEESSDKTAHSEGDVLGDGTETVVEPLDVSDLGEQSCIHFGGDGDIDDDTGDGTTAVEEWTDCMIAAATCQADQQISVQYPRALEWLGEVRDGIVALDDEDPNDTDPAGPDLKVQDALTALDSLKESLDGNEDGVLDIACGPRALTRTGQSASYGAGDDGDLEAGAELRYVDNGDGTITDLNTGLQWEKKADWDNSPVICTDETGSCADPHDADNRYAWTAGSTAYDGPIVTIFLEQLNNRCASDVMEDCTTNGDDDCEAALGPDEKCGFAGYRDWRVPNVKELPSIVDYDVFSPTVDVAFHDGSCSGTCTVTSCSCTASSLSNHWSSTSIVFDPNDAWLVGFGAGIVTAGDKILSQRVRAVRGGL